MSISSGCACGSVTYKGDADQGFSCLCQCRSCQHTTGSGQLAQFVYPKSALKVTRTISAESAMITAGSLDQPNQYQPTKILFAEVSSHWDNPALPDLDGAST